MIPHSARLLTDLEETQLLMALLTGPDDVTEADAALVLRWARGIRVQQLLLAAALTETAVLRIVDGHVLVEEVR